MKLLLANGAASGINALFQKKGTSCLHIAAKNGNKEMVELLLDKGGNPNLKNREGETPVMVASTVEVKDSKGSDA